MDQSTKEAWTGSSGKLSPEAAQKRKAINSKIVRYGCLPIIGLFVLLMLIGIFADDPKKEKPTETEESSEASYSVANDPLHVGLDSVKALVGKKLPSEKWDVWGIPETLEGSTNRYWLAYAPKANITIVSVKQTQLVEFASFDKESAIQYVQEREKERQKLIKDQFSAWDGSHLQLTKVIKKAMNDPKSFEHDETNYWDLGDHLVVMTSYRGKNGFGGVVKNWVKAKVDLQTGQVLEIVDQGN